MNSQQINQLKKHLSAAEISTNDSTVLAFLLCAQKATASEIITHTNLDKSSVYYSLKSLTNQGLIFEEKKKYKNIYFIRSKKDLIDHLNTKERRLKKASLKIKETLNKLIPLEFLPQTLSFEGEEGLKKAQEDLLSKPKIEILLYTNQETEKNFFPTKEHNSFIQGRIKNNIRIKVLAIRSKRSEILQKYDNKCLRETRFLPNNFDFKAETYIYDNKILMLDHHQNIVGILIQNKGLYSIQKQLFEHTWKNLK